MVIYVLFNFSDFISDGIYSKQRLSYMCTSF